MERPHLPFSGPPSPVVTMGSQHHQSNDTDQTHAAQSCVASLTHTCVVPCNR